MNCPWTSPPPMDQRVGSRACSGESRLRQRSGLTNWPRFGCRELSIPRSSNRSTSPRWPSTSLNAFGPKVEGVRRIDWGPMPGADSIPFACPVCASTQARWAAEHRELRIARCNECGHGYVWPVPNADFLDGIYRNLAYYQGSEGSIGFRDYASLEPARIRMFTRHLTKIEAEVGPGRILDVGCATGDFLKVARGRGWQVLAADPSVARAQVEAAGIDLVGTNVQDADVEEGSLDAITFWDVLEHVTDPLADLSRAQQLLR